MTVDYYRTIFLKQWKTMLLCSLTVVLGVFLISKFMTPVYQASTVMQVTPHLSTGQDAASAAPVTDRLVQTEAQLAISDAVLREVAAHFQGEDMTRDQLARKTTVSPKADTQLFEITVQDASSAHAAALANDIAQTLLKQQSALNAQASAQTLAQIQQDLASTQQQIDTLLEQISGLQEQNKKPSAQLLSLQMQLNGWQQHYTQLQTEQAQLELVDAQNNHMLQILQLAQPDGHVIRPNLPLNLLASLPVAFSLSILLALLLELCNTHVRTPEALSQLLQWPVLAPMWRVRGVVERRELVHLPDQEATNVESYRTLRANLAFSCIDRSVRTLIVTSAVPGEGKSVIAANLAISMARVGKNTLLVDADLRRPLLHELFSIDADKMGLSDAILTASTPEATSRRVRAQFLTPLSQGSSLGLPRAPRFSIDSFVHDVGIANLRVMPAGTLPPDPPGLLDSRAMQRLFIALEQSDADIIIFDAPGLLAFPDASILSARVDGTLVVVDASRVRKGELRQLKALLTQSGAQVLGCVMNRLRAGRHDASRPYADLAEEELSEEQLQPASAVVAAASLARSQLLSAGRSGVHVALTGNRRKTKIHHRSRRNL